MNHKPITMAELRRIIARMKRGDTIAQAARAEGRSANVYTAAHKAGLGAEWDAAIKKSKALREAPRQHRITEAVADSEIIGCKAACEKWDVSRNALLIGRRAAGLKHERYAPFSPRRRITPANASKALSWRLDGWSYAAVAERLGVTTEGARLAIYQEAARLDIAEEWLRKGRRELSATAGRKTA